MALSSLSPRAQLHVQRLLEGNGSLNSGQSRSSLNDLCHPPMKCQKNHLSSNSLRIVSSHPSTSRSRNSVLSIAKSMSATPSRCDNHALHHHNYYGEAHSTKPPILHPAEAPFHYTDDDACTPSLTDDTSDHPTICPTDVSHSMGPLHHGEAPYVVCDPSTIAAPAAYVTVDGPTMMPVGPTVTQPTNDECHLANIGGNTASFSHHHRVQRATPPPTPVEDTSLSFPVPTFETTLRTSEDHKEMDGRGFHTVHYGPDEAHPYTSVSVPGDLGDSRIYAHQAGRYSQPTCDSPNDDTFTEDIMYNAKGHPVPMYRTSLGNTVLGCEEDLPPSVVRELAAHRAEAGRLLTERSEMQARNSPTAHTRGPSHEVEIPDGTHATSLAPPPAVAKRSSSSQILSFPDEYTSTEVVEHTENNVRWQLIAAQSEEYLRILSNAEEELAGRQPRDSVVSHYRHSYTPTQYDESGQLTTVEQENVLTVCFAQEREIERLRAAFVVADERIAVLEDTIRALRLQLVLEKANKRRT